MTTLDVLTRQLATHRLMVNRPYDEYGNVYRCTCNGWDDQPWEYADTRGGPEGAGEAEESHARHAATAILADGVVTVTTDHDVNDDGVRVEPAAFTVYPAGWDDSDVEWGGYHFLLRVESRGKGTWCVTDGFEVFTREGDHEYEPRPSSREDDFLARTRFTLDEAKGLAMRLVGTRVVGKGVFTAEKARVVGAETKCLKC